MEKMHIQTSAGFEWDMDPAVMDDILVIEDLAALAEIITAMGDSGKK